jgi:hypothetical protein
MKIFKNPKNLKIPKNPTKIPQKYKKIQKNPKPKNFENFTNILKNSSKS